jgi:sigma-E factor negative regulatory protein RseB
MFLKLWHLDPMTWTQRQLLATTAVVLSCLSVASAQESSPQTWLDRMNGAVQSASYEGTVIRVQNDQVEALKVLVEDWNNQSTLVSSLPSNEIGFGTEYDLSIVREDRVAGRKAVLIAIRPHDEYRYGHRLWLDSATGFPLQTKMIAEDGEPIEQVKFADIQLNSEIQASALEPSVSTDNFRWFTQPKRQVTETVKSAWSADDLPSGFRAVSTHQEKLAGREATVIHILYSDGLANVSVFVEPVGDKKIAQRSRVGSSNSYSVRVDGHQVTAIGEVPSVTVEKIATSMQPN